MRKLTISAGAVFVLAMALWMLPPNAEAAERGKTSVKASAHVAGIVIGKPVYSERNVVLGTVENVVLNDSGCARYVIVAGTFEGAHSRLFPVPWTVIARTGPDAIFVRVDEKVLVQAPSFEVNRWPDFSRAEWETKVHNFYRAGAQATVKEKKRPAAVSPEEKAKAESRARERVKDWRERATEGRGAAEEKAKSALEKERKRTPTEMTPGQSSEQKKMDLKKEQQTQPEKQRMMRDAPKMMEREQPKQMMEKGPSQQKIHQGASQTERGRSQTMEKPEKGEAAPRGLQ